MKTYITPARSEWARIIERPQLDHQSLTGKVTQILNAVKKDGDPAIKQYTTAFDGVTLEDFTVCEQEWNEAEQLISPALKQAIGRAAVNIEAFHKMQTAETTPLETQPGVLCWRKSVGIEKVGLYIPGGSAPLFSTILMLGIPARLAGCKEVVLCSPPDRAGRLHPAILYAAKLTGIRNVFKIGGVQAIGAMAYGTQTVPRVFKIFGPGNQYVTCAKELVQHAGTAIDMPAGPSEVLVLADGSANPIYIAADLLSQAEHGPDSQAMLITTSETIADAVQQEVTRQLEDLPRKAIAIQALQHSKIIVLATMEEAVELTNAYAAEHLIISTDEPQRIADAIINAGSVFLGHYSPESVGDYASGTNHTLPTNGHSVAYSGVSLDSFTRKITFQQLTPAGLSGIAETVITLAEAEGLRAHGLAVSRRLQEEEKKENRF